MRAPVGLAALLLTGSFACAQEVSIGVLGLFHPRQLVVSAPVGSALVIHAGQQAFTLENSSSPNSAKVQSAGSGMLLSYGTLSVESSVLAITNRENGPVDFLLSVPGKISRHYRGRLEIKAVSGILFSIVSMDIEAAVASVVAAESLPGAPIEALKAQAVAARSYFAAGKGRHDQFDFCDTTHYQFLRAPPSVECKYCRQHPTNWRNRISRQDAAQLRNSDEASRLEAGRRLGWNVIQSDDFSVRIQGLQVVVEGSGQGHGIGLCQTGARAMAQDGSDYRQILAHYYPNTKLANLTTEVPNKD